jgi:DNA-directed RNA polymerase specialized sigma24 family protein
LLAGGTPREILCRIVQGDPLGIRDRVARRLRASAYLVDADRVQLRALARCARFAQRYAGRPELATWLDEIVDAAVEDLVREDTGTDGGAEVAEVASDTAFIALARPLGLEPAAMRRACAAFNRLPAIDRASFFDLVIDGGSLDELARRSGESASEIARRARRALDVLLQVPAVVPAPREPDELQLRGASKHLSRETDAQRSREAAKHAMRESDAQRLREAASKNVSRDAAATNGSRDKESPGRAPSAKGSEDRI